jgi:hypothetical protein|eukprot:COSAG01_NODE_207_length_22017_cov_118.361164_21_plen_62_part_00
MDARPWPHGWLVAHLQQPYSSRAGDAAPRRTHHCNRRQRHRIKTRAHGEHAGRGPTKCEGR